MYLLHTRDTDEAYQLYQAITDNDGYALFKLLQRGVDPNIFYNNKTLLYHAIPNGKSFADTSEVRLPELTEISNHLPGKKPKNSADNILQIVKYLLVYDADPALNDTAFSFYFMLYAKQKYSFGLVDPAKWQDYVEIIKLFSLADNFKLDLSSLFDHVYSLKESDDYDVMHVTRDVKQRMAQRQQSKGCVKSVTVNADNPFKLWMHMHDGAVLEIESITAEQLTQQSEKYHELLQLFKRYFRINNIKRYFTEQLRKTNGALYVDILKLNNKLAGFFIYEIIYAYIQKKIPL